MEDYLENKKLPCIVFHRWLEMMDSESLHLSKKQFDEMIYYYQEEGEDEQLQLDYHCTDFNCDSYANENGEHN